VVAINEFVGPVLFKLGLQAAREVGGLGDEGEGA
jgi:hypothetical protein